jgi:lipopolysaccharide/colanic/teichoic acid biosynthesis glycosyltransferase
VLALAQLEPVAERVVDEQAVDAADTRVVCALDARVAQAGTDGREIVRDEPRMRLPRRHERILDAEVQLLVAGAEPDAAAGADRLGLRHLLEAEQRTVEAAGRVLRPRWDGDLDVVEAEDAHCAKVYHRSVAAQLEDTLVTGYTRLAAETPRRRIDLELRALDVLFAAFFGLLLLPFALLIGLAVAVAAGRPILYRGERVGRSGRVFRMLKFRTLRHDAESRLGPYLGEELVRRTGAEYTRIGRWLKASQLDEVPQLWNVLRGDMSFVGPRPIRPRFFAELATELPAYWQRLVVRPGLTGFAQVRAGYETSMGDKLAHDLEWIADRSVRLYLRTLSRTAARVVRQTIRR